MVGYPKLNVKSSFGPCGVSQTVPEEFSAWNHPVGGKEPSWSLAGTGGLSLFEVFKGTVVSAGQFHDVPFRPQLKIQLCFPCFGERFRIFHGDIDLHVVAINAVEPFGDVQLIAVRMAVAVEPGL